MARGTVKFITTKNFGDLRGFAGSGGDLRRKLFPSGNHSLIECLVFDYFIWSEL